MQNCYNSYLQVAKFTHVPQFWWYVSSKFVAMYITEKEWLYKPLIKEKVDGLGKKSIVDDTNSLPVYDRLPSIVGIGHTSSFSLRSLRNQ